jgi:hypothetical protein
MKEGFALKTPPEAIVVAIVFLAYWAVLTITNGFDPIARLTPAIVNTATLVIVALGARLVIARLVNRAPSNLRLAAHCIGAALFALSWCWLLMVALGLSAGRSLVDFQVRLVFPGPAVAWQLMQGLCFYALLALYEETRAWRHAAPAREISQSRKRFFVKVGDALRPLDARDIISIAGADDYSEVTSTSGRSLVRMSLAEFESLLDPSAFVRVHRSHIVNIHRIVSAEPTGDGRLLLHLEQNQTMTASRAGTKALRALALQR